MVLVLVIIIVVIVMIVMVVSLALFTLTVFTVLMMVVMLMLFCLEKCSSHVCSCKRLFDCLEDLYSGELVPGCCDDL